MVIKEKTVIQMDSDYITGVYSFGAIVLFCSYEEAGIVRLGIKFGNRTHLYGIYETLLTYQKHKNF